MNIDWNAFAPYASLAGGIALAALGMGARKAVVFVGAMLLGMGIFDLLEGRPALSLQKA